MLLLCKIVHLAYLFTVASKQHWYRTVRSVFFHDVAFVLTIIFLGLPLVVNWNKLLFSFKYYICIYQQLTLNAHNEIMTHDETNNLSKEIVFLFSCFIRSILASRYYTNKPKKKNK